MKNKKFLINVITVICLMITATLGLNSVTKSYANNEVEIVTTLSKQSYTLGEPISLLLEVKNSTDKEAVFINSFDPVYGSLKLYIFNDNRSINYEYTNPKYGVLETGGFIKLKANDKVSNSIKVLARLKSYDQADYFFNEEGDYNVQVSYLVQLIGQTKPIEIKSNTVKFTVKKPQGEDLEVWNKIKGNSNFGYFIQEGDFLIPSYRLEERSKLQSEIESIIYQYPNSFYAQPLRQSLDKFKANEAKRQELVERIKPKP